MFDAESFDAVLSKLDIIQVWSFCLDTLAKHEGVQTEWKVVSVLSAAAQKENHELTAAVFAYAARVVSPEVFTKNDGKLSAFFESKGYKNLVPRR